MWAAGFFLFLLPPHRQTPFLIRFCDSSHLSGCSPCLLPSVPRLTKSRAITQPLEKSQNKQVKLNTVNHALLIERHRCTFLPRFGKKGIEGGADLRKEQTDCSLHLCIIWFLSCENFPLRVPPMVTAKVKNTDSLIFFSLIRGSHLLQQSHNSIKKFLDERGKNGSFGLRKGASGARREKKIHCEVHCPCSISLSLSLARSLSLPPLLFKAKRVHREPFRPFTFFFFADTFQQAATASSKVDCREHG